MYKLCLDYGHGGKDPGATYKGRKEATDNLYIGKKVANELRKYKVIVDETRTEDVTVSLKNRSRFENKKTYDYFISFHRNAFSAGKAKGVETFTYLTSTVNSKSTQLAKKIQNELVNLGFVNRGVKRANFHVLRETKAPAVLIEIGFIDNIKDNELFDSKKEEIVRAITKAILTQLNITYKDDVNKIEEKSKEQIFYRVMAGSFAEKENAENQVKRLKNSGFDATIMIYKLKP